MLIFKISAGHCWIFLSFFSTKIYSEHKFDFMNKNGCTVQLIEARLAIIN